MDATPVDILRVLHELGLTENVVDYVEEPEALEWRTSTRLSGRSPDVIGPDLDNMSHTTLTTGIEGTTAVA